MKNIAPLVTPIFRLQQRFRKHGPFLSFLESRNVHAQAIPSYSAVRWYSSSAVFIALRDRWDHLVDFARQEHLVIDELNDQVKANIQALAQISGQFALAQKDLESDEFGIGSRFIGNLLAVTHLVDKFEDQVPSAIEAFHTQIEDFRRNYAKEYIFLLLMTYLDPSVQFIRGRTCCDTDYDDMVNLLEIFISQELTREEMEIDVAAEPGSDDFVTYITSRSQPTSGAEQLLLYAQIREARFHSRAFWTDPHPEMQQLAKVAIRVLSCLTTSASVERTFSIARAVCTDYQMAMTQETISSRVMIRANWSLVEHLVKEALEMSPWVRTQLLRSHAHPWEESTWRLGIPDAEAADMDEEDFLQ
jgi:hypothetical protein